ncbi:MAG TPA: UDP-N-acetyl-D-glucosamine dehydrogenase, partial [Synergistaceae bacterium]|nr:UDP-N-acetyl-D-glucosamine dehydrogenase [Synergistaceae bacterium]
KGARVTPVDPYCPSVRWNGETRATAELSADLLRGADAVVVASGHRHRVDYALLVEHARLILDAKNVVAPALKKSPADIAQLALL